MNGAAQALTYDAIGSVAAGQPRWYAVQTRPRHEKKVAIELQEKGITTYLPLLTQVRRWSDRRKVIQIPLFSCYAFVHAALVPQVHAAVVRVWGVLGFVGQQNHGIPIPDKQIEDIRILLDHNIPLTPYPFLKVGQRVRVRGGALDGIEGILVTQGSRRLVISVESVHHSLSLNIEGCDVEPI
ncbi:MAG TPA: UpxY family transcription antiterminator [Terriglobales bacterium]|jgi:transcription antitermination factor NusG|nr:UpxY family transcription antiterminator [Terriglobales bacterium]